jgi:hypothetical protein
MCSSSPLVVAFGRRLAQALDLFTQHSPCLTAPRPSEQLRTQAHPDAKEIKN